MAKRDITPADLTNWSISVPISIRVCTAPQVRELEWFGLFTPHRRIIREAFARQRKGEVVMLVAEFNQAPIGQIWIDLVRRDPGKTGWLWALRVFPWFRRMGIGGRLIAAAEELLAARGYVRAELGVELHNHAARRLYERIGYRVSGPMREEFSYRTPGGVWRHVYSEQLLLGKKLPRPGAQRDGEPQEISGSIPAPAPSPSEAARTGSPERSKSPPAGSRPEKTSARPRSRPKQTSGARTRKK